MFMWLADFLSFDRHSKEATFITISLAALNFITYLIVPVMATWDMRDHMAAKDGIVRQELAVTDSEYSIYARGIYKDFNGQWFQDVGKSIMTSMTLNIFMPAIEFGIFWFIRYMKRLWD